MTSLILEKSSKGTLHDYIESHKSSNTPIKERKIWKFIVQVLLALYEFRCYELVHCDIKPSNILVEEEDRYLVADLNAAVSNKTVVKETIKTTPYYCR